MAATALKRFVRAREGNIAVFAALCFPVLIAVGVFAIDEGALFNERRELQGLADLAAMSAAAHPDKAEDAVLMTLLDNGLPVTLAALGRGDAGIPVGDATARLTAGRYDGNALLPPERRFTPGAAPVNAFKVELEKHGQRFLAEGWMPAPLMRAAAIGHAAPEASFRVGSRLARLDGGVANAVLGALLGARLSLSVMDYRALADAQVDMLDLCEALYADLHLKAGTYSEVLDASVTLPQLLETLARMRGRDAVAAAALRQAARIADRRLALSLRPLLDPGTAGAWSLGLRRGPVSAAASVLELVEAAAGAANGGHQVEADLGAAVPGLLEASLTLAIGEREQASPWMRIGERDDAVRTAQTRFLLRLRLGGPGGALGGTVDLPIYGELGFAEARLAQVSCLPGKPAPTRVTVNARPGIARLRIGEVEPSALGDFRREPAGKPALLVDARLVKVFGASSVSIASAKAESLGFSTKEIEAQTTKTVAVRDPVASATASLVGGLQLDVQAGPLSASLPGVLKADLLRVLGTAAEPIDAVLAALLDTLGLSLGEADVTVSGGICNRAVLVQ